MSLKVTFEITQLDMDTVGYEDFDYGFVKRTGVLDKNYTCNSPLILRHVMKQFTFEREGYKPKTITDYIYVLIERATGKELGCTDVYDSDDEYFAQKDFDEHIDKVAMSYGTFAQDYKKYKIVKVF